MDTKQFKQTDAGAAGVLRIDKVTVKWLCDESPDTSWLGEYSNESTPGAIINVGEHTGKFLYELGDDDYLPKCGRNYRYFIPYAGGEKPGSKDFETYAKQDFARMEGLERGNWGFQGCIAKAELSYPIGQGSRRLETVSSGGLWDIESDSDKEYLRSIEDEQLADLADHLGSLCGLEVTTEQLKGLI